MGAKTKTQFTRRLNRWRLKKSPMKVAFLLFLWLIAMVSEVRASGDLKNNGTINNTGTIKVKNQALGLPANINGTVEFFGANQSIPEKNYNNLSITGTGINNTIGGVNFTVNGDLSITSTAQLNVETGKAITLGGNINEQGYLSGSIQKIVDLTSIPSSNFGGIGATLSWTGTSPGLTTVKRTSGIALSGGGNQSIMRYYDIALSSSGFNGTMIFQYDATNELNSLNENTLELWRSIDGGVSWRRQGGTVNTSTHTITKTGILAFSRWTASDATHPLGPSGYEWTAQTIAAASGSGQTAGLGATLPGPFVVTVTDAYGNVIPNTAVTFAIASVPGGASGQSLSVTNALTNASGQASTVLHLGSVAGSYSVTATSGSLTGSPVTFNATASVAPPTLVATSIVQTAGTGQTDTVGRQLGSPMVVTVLDQFGAPFAGAVVNFAIQSAPDNATGQQLSTLSVTTGAGGQASTRLTLGSRPGSYSVRATSPALSGAFIVFNATAVVGRPAFIASISGGGQSQVVKSVLVQPLVVLVRDSLGNTIPGVDVHFAITSAPTGASGQHLSDTLVVTDSIGYARTSLTLGDSVGVYQVSATSGSLQGSPVVFAETATSAAVQPFASSITLTSGNSQSGVVGTQAANPLVVRVRDQFGAPFKGATVTFRVTSSPASDPFATLTATTVTTNDSGWASTNLVLGHKVGTYSVAATSGTLAGSPVTFTIVGLAGRPISIAQISGNNQTGLVNSVLPLPLVVSVADTFGNAKQAVAIRFAFASFPAGSTGQALSDTAVITGPDGRASSSLTLGTVAGTYQVTATSNGLVGSPIIFGEQASATPPKPVATSIALSSGNFQTGAVGVQTPNPLVVTVFDQFGTPFAGASVTFAIASVPNADQFAQLTATTVTTNANGQASTNLILGHSIGTYSVVATSGSLSGSPVTFNAIAVAGKAVYLTLTSGDRQAVLATTALLLPLAVSVTDSFGNAKQGVNVDFAITAFPSGAAGQTLTATHVVTDVDGRAAVGMTLGSRMGTYQVSATSGSLLGSPVTFTIMATGAEGSSQVGLVDNRLQQPFSTLILDANGKPLAGVLVTFTINSTPSGATGQSFNGATTITVLTDSNGVASVFLTLGNQAGTYQVTATSPYLTNPVVFNAVATPSTSRPTMVYSSGDAQTAPILTQPVSPLVVTVLDGSGNPFAGQTVTFSLVSSPAGATGQLVNPVTVVTDVLGHASTSVTVGSKVGAYRIAAFSAGLNLGPVEFKVHATASVARALVYVAGDRQSKQVGSTLDSAFIVRVVDMGDNPLAGVAVQFTVDSIPNGTTGQKLAVLNEITDAQGQAAAVLTFGDHAGVYRVSATVNGLNSVVFRANAVTSSGAVSIAYTAGNAQSAPIQTSLINPLVVTVLGTSGNPIAGQTVTFAIDSIPSGATGQLVTPSTVMSDASGRASTVVKLGNKVGVYRISAVSTGLSGSPVVFRVSAFAGAPRALVYIVGDGQSKQIGATLDSALVVRVVDQGGNVVPGVSVSFSLDSIPDGATGQRLSVQSSVTDVQGRVSAFLTLGTKIGKYVVSATSDALTGSPVKFTELAIGGAATAIVLTSGSDQTGFISSVLTSPFVVTVVDFGGNPVPGTSVQFAIDSIPNGAVGQSLRILNSITDINGQAAAILTMGNKEGRYTVTATSKNLIVGTVRFAATAAVLRGDVNNDLAIDIADLTSIINQILGRTVLVGSDSVRSDVNRDGRVDIADVVMLQNNLLTISGSLASSTADSIASLVSLSAQRLSSGSDSASVRAEFVLTQSGLRFNVANAVPLKGLELIVRFRSSINVRSLDAVFPRAMVDSFYVNSSGRELHIVGYNLKNNPIAIGDGSLFRIPLILYSVDDIESSQLVISTADTNAIFDKAVRITPDKRLATPTDIPSNFVLYQNYPNPFNGTTRIEYEVPDVDGRGAKVLLQVFDLLGGKIKTLVSSTVAGGRYGVMWDGTDEHGAKVASGTYYYRLISGTYVSGKKMILLK